MWYLYKTRPDCCINMKVDDNIWLVLQFRVRISGSVSVKVSAGFSVIVSVCG